MHTFLPSGGTTSGYVGSLESGLSEVLHQDKIPMVPGKSLILKEGESEPKYRLDYQGGSVPRSGVSWPRLAMPPHESSGPWGSLRS